MYDCCCIDGEAPSVCDRGMVTARKSHRCCECGGIINPGDTYERVNGCWDGSWSTFKTCRTCASIRDDLFSCGFIYGGLAEALSECHGVDLVAANKEQKHAEE